MKPCCIENLVYKGLEENFELSPEGEQVTCPTCHTTVQSTNGQWKEISQKEE